MLCVVCQCLFVHVCLKMFNLIFLQIYFLYRSEDAPCTKTQMKLVFLKTHKTGSSTITSILNRFADIKEIDIALPRISPRFDWPKEFSHKTVDRTRLIYKKANILCNHLVFNKKELEKIMYPDFKLITIVRNPVDRFYSMFHYGNFEGVYKLKLSEDPVETFFNNISKYYRKFYSPADPELHFKETLLRNGMAFDLNYQRFHKDNNKTFKDFVHYVDATFDFVLVNELFDEGLLILKKLMCWTLMDIVYSSKLVNPKLQSTKAMLSRDIKKKINQWSSQDFIIHNHFKKKLQKLISKQPEEKFEEEVFKFRRLNKLVSRYCTDNSTDNLLEVGEYLYEIREEQSEEFANRPACFCLKLMRSESQYINYFERKFPTFYFYKHLKRRNRIWHGC